MTHRCSLPLPNNDFLIDTDQERPYSTALSTTVPMKFLGIPDAAEIEYHRANGYSANCVICRDEARKADYQSRAFAEEVLNGDFSNFESKPVDVETMQRQLDELETAWTDALTKEQASAIFEQMTELQFAIEKINGRMDDYADGRRMHRAGAL